MPGMDGIAATAQLRDRLPPARVLVLTTDAGDGTILPALRAGAHGHLTKDASAEQIEAAIRAVHAGQTHPGPLVQERLAAAVTGPPPEAQRPAPTRCQPGSPHAKPRCSPCSRPDSQMPRSPSACAHRPGPR